MLTTFQRHLRAGWAPILAFTNSDIRVEPLPVFIPCNWLERRLMDASPIVGVSVAGEPNGGAEIPPNSVWLSF